MKKLILSFLLLFSLSFSAAAGEMAFCIGFAKPLQKTYADDESGFGHGYALDFQMREFEQSGFSLTAEVTLGFYTNELFTDHENDSVLFADFKFLFGAGYDFFHSLKSRRIHFVLSAVAGCQYMPSYHDDFCRHGKKDKANQYILTVSGGADAFFSCYFSDNFGIYIDVTAFASFGGTEKKFNSCSKSISTFCTDLTLLPKIGIVWKK